MGLPLEQMPTGLSPLLCFLPRMSLYPSLEDLKVDKVMRVS